MFIFAFLTNPFLSSFLHLFPRRSYRNSPVIRIVEYICYLFFFFSIKTLSSKSVVFEERTVCLLARFTPAESGEIKLYRPPVFGIFPSLSNSPTRFLKIYEPARDLTPFCESLHVAIRLLLHSTDFHENCGAIIAFVDFSLL